MSIVLNRIDDRLIHGQVVLGWCGPLRITRIILVDGDVADSAAEQELYRMSVPDGIEVIFASLAEAQTRLHGWHEDAVRTLVLTGSIGTMRDLYEADGEAVHDINLGGVHLGPGREKVLRYVFLSPAERETLQALAAEGAHISAQDLPGTRPVPLAELA